MTAELQEGAGSRKDVRCAHWMLTLGTRRVAPSQGGGIQEREGGRVG
jgi:hypothetical protein